jgi:hypothetical protein
MMFPVEPRAQINYFVVIVPPKARICTEIPIMFVSKQYFPYFLSFRFIFRVFFILIYGQTYVNKLLNFGVFRQLLAICFSPKPYSVRQREHIRHRLHFEVLIPFSETLKDPKIHK